MVPGDKDTVRLINDQLRDVRKYRELNDYFNQNQGRRWINRSKIFMDWLWKHRDAILSILGLVLTFADDGTKTLRRVEDVEAEKEKAEKGEATEETPDGEEIEDFTDTPSDSVPDLGVGENTVPSSADSDLADLKAYNAGLPYDIGAKNDAAGE